MPTGPIYFLLGLQLIRLLRTLSAALTTHFMDFNYKTISGKDWFVHVMRFLCMNTQPYLLESLHLLVEFALKFRKPVPNLTHLSFEGSFLFLVLKLQSIKSIDRAIT